jgi:hypothetical protein
MVFMGYRIAFRGKPFHPEKLPRPAGTSLVSAATRLSQSSAAAYPSRLSAEPGGIKRASRHNHSPKWQNQPSIPPPVSANTLLIAGLQ